MKDETKIWLKYADENLQSAKILEENSLFNPCLQNIQQAVEKSLIAEFSMEFKKTHSISELRAMLMAEGKNADSSFAPLCEPIFQGFQEMVDLENPLFGQCEIRHLHPIMTKD